MHEIVLLLLSVIPLVAIGGVVYFAVRMAIRHERPPRE